MYEARQATAVERGSARDQAVGQPLHLNLRDPTQGAVAMDEQSARGDDRFAAGQLPQLEFPTDADFRRQGARRTEVEFPTGADFLRLGDPKKENKVVDSPGK